MAVVMMGGDEKKPIFHDFLATTCGNSPATIFVARDPTEVITTSTMETEASASASASAIVSSIGQGIITGSADPVSGRLAANNSAFFLIHGRKDDSTGTGFCNTFSRRKRSNSDSNYTGIITDKIRPVCADAAAECSRSLKPQMLGKKVIINRPGKNQEDEMQFSMQLPLRPTSLPSLSSRPVLLSSKFERSIPMNAGSVVHYPSRFSKSGPFSSSSSVSKDANVSAIIMSHPAADEGSRTGVKGSGVLNVVTSSSGAGESSLARVLSNDSKPKYKQINEPEPSNALRYNSMPNVGRQMTIFYAGQAHVFDDVNPNKAEVIMALAGSTGGSWSTTYSHKPATWPSASDAKAPSEEIQRHIRRFPSIQGIAEHALSQVEGTTLTRDNPSLTPGGQKSGKVVRDG